MNTKTRKRPQTATNDEDKQFKIVMARMFAEYLQRMKAHGAIDSACGKDWHGWISFVQPGEGRQDYWRLDVTRNGLMQEPIEAETLEEVKVRAFALYG